MAGRLANTVIADYQVYTGDERIVRDKIGSKLIPLRLGRDRVCTGGYVEVERDFYDLAGGDG